LLEQHYLHLHIFQQAFQRLFLVVFQQAFQQAFPFSDLKEVLAILDLQQRRQLVFLGSCALVLALLHAFPFPVFLARPKRLYLQEDFL